jgi:hypothetical protein
MEAQPAVTFVLLLAVLAAALLLFGIGFLLSRLLRRRPPAYEVAAPRPGSRFLVVSMGVLGLLVLLALAFYSLLVVRVDRARHEATVRIGEAVPVGPRPDSERRRTVVREDGDSRSAGREPSAVSGAAAGPFELQLHVADALELWKRTFPDYAAWAASALSSGVPEWVLLAGGSEYQARELSGRLSVRCRFPGPQGRVVGYSGLDVSPDEALLQARRAAIEQLKAVLIWHLAETASPRLANLADLDRRAQALLEREATASGSWQTSAVLNAGTFFRAALALDASSRRLEEHGQRLLKEMQVHAQSVAASRRHLATDVASALGLALCIFLLYCFLNAGTKGYFAWPLRIVSLGTLVLIYVLALIA